MELTKQLNRKKMVQISPELERKIIELIKQNKLIEAVALVKKETNLGLKESKDIVDKYKSQNYV